MSVVVLLAREEDTIIAHASLAYFSPGSFSEKNVRSPRKRERETLKVCRSLIDGSFLWVGRLDVCTGGIEKMH